MRIGTEATERCDECLSPETLFMDGKYQCMACRYAWDPERPYEEQASQGKCPRCYAAAVKLLKNPNGKGHVRFCESCRWMW